MTTFEEFITKPVSKKIALLEAAPGLHLTSWTLDSGNIYYATFNETIINEPALINKVKENGISLDQKASKGEMTQKSWYQDVSAGRLYVWCSDDGNPNARMMVAYFEVYFGTEAKIFNAAYYQPRITDGGISLTAAGELIDGGQITLLNGDGWFDKRMANWLWRGARATLLMGGDEMTCAEYEKICNLRVQGLSWEDGAVRMSIKGMKVEWRKRLPINEIYTDKKVLRPNGNGYHTTWDGDYNKVNEEIADGDASYIRTDGGGLPKESYTLDVSSIPDGATIEYLALYIRGRKEIDDDGRIRFLIRIGTTDYIKYPGNRWDTKYQTKVHVWPVNPATGTAWMKSDIQNLQAGVEGDVKKENQALRVTQIYAEASISLMREFDEGKPMPLILGEGELTPVLENKDYKKGKFRIADGSVQTLKEITKVEYEEVEIPSDKLEKNLSECWFAIETAWPGTIENPANVRCKVKGAVRNDIPGITGDDSLITCASDILRFILGVMGYDENDLDIPSFDSAKSANQECKLFITSLTYAEDVINWLRQSVHGLFGQNREGKIYFKLWNEDATGALVIDCDREALEFRVMEQEGPICDRAICKFGKDADTGKWLFASEGDSSLKHLYPQTETRAFETALANKGDAEAEAHEFLTSHRPAPMECEVVVKLQAAKIEVGDKVKLTRSRAPDGTGSWMEKVFQVKEVQREPGNRTRLLLESNLPCLDYQLKGFEQAENPDIQDGMQCALAVYDKSAQQVKTSKVVAESIKPDEALRRQDIVTTQVLANSAQAVVHGLDYPPEYIVSMFSSDQGSVYSHVSPFTDLNNFVSGWHIQTIATAEMLNQATDGNMEAEGTNAYEAVNNATLTKETGTPHGGQRCLRVRAESGKSYGGAKQVITTLVPGPASLNPAGVVDGRVWARAPVGGNSLFRLYSGPVANPTAHLIGEIRGYSTSWEELTLLRKMMPAGDKRVVAILYIEGNTDTFYAEFDDLDVCWAEKCVHIANIGGVDKDFKVRIFKEQAGS